MTSLDEIAHDLASGVVGPIFLVERALESAERSEHVFIQLFRERALREAHAAQERWRAGRPLSRLDGLPIAWKDLFNIEGAHCSAGSLTRLKAPAAQQDAVAVARARKLGLVTLAVTNLSEFAYSGLGLNPHFGTPIADLPTKLRRAPGGSSSGSAIAVQRGIVQGAIGSDTAGSLRVPAAFNGLAGFRPSLGRYSTRGVYPLSRKLDTIGPLARSARDCAWLDRVLRGVNTGPDGPIDLRDVRFVVETSMTDAPDVDDAIRENVMRAADRLKAAGAAVENRSLHTIARTIALIEDAGWLGAIDILESHLDVLAGPGRAVVDPRVVERLEKARTISAKAKATIFSAYRSFKSKLRNELGSAVLITPTTTMTAPELAPLERDPKLFAKVNLRALRLTMIGSFLRMPGIALPSGVDLEGLPTSVLLSMCEGHDDMLLRVGMAVEHELNA